MTKLRKLSEPAIVAMAEHLLAHSQETARANYPSSDFGPPVRLHDLPWTLQFGWLSAARDQIEKET